MPCCSIRSQLSPWLPVFLHVLVPWVDQPTISEKGMKGPPRSRYRIVRILASDASDASDGLAAQGNTSSIEPNTFRIGSICGKESRSGVRRRPAYPQLRWQAGSSLGDVQRAMQAACSSCAVSSYDHHNQHSRTGIQILIRQVPVDQRLS